MPPTSKGFLSETTVTLLYVAAALVVFMLLGYGYTAYSTSELTNEEAVNAVETASRVWLWVFVLGAAAALAAVYYRGRGKVGGMEVGPLVQLLTRHDYQKAADALRAAGTVDDDLERSLAHLAEQRRKLTETLQQHRANMAGNTTSMTGLNESIEQGLGTLRQLERSIDEIAGLQQGSGEGIEGLSRCAEETSSSILEMTAINNEVAENSRKLSTSVEETTTAIEEMTFSVKEVARNVDELSTAAEETATSMNQMDVSISQVDTNASETARLSETVTADAETGVSAINKTIDGIDRIKHTSRVAADVIGTLGQRIAAIGNILTVIDDVAEQTNLLALNAAIIAAQAGEHGRGFAVVADEIKALAERTGSSTKEIAELVKTVQTESKNAIDVMSKGVEDVEEGVRLGHNAEDALRNIVDSAKRSTLMIKAIAQATVEQAKGSKQVTNAIIRIAETVQQIALATSEQAKGSEQIMRSAENMKVITQQVARSTEEQNRGSLQISQAIENIRQSTEKISAAQRDQANIAKKFSQASTHVRETCQHAGTTAHEIDHRLAEDLAEVDRLIHVLTANE